jgi:hypothetical protein
VNTKLNVLHSWLGNLSLELGDDLAFFQPTSASRTAGRQRYFYNLVDAFGEGPAISAPILFACFASGLLRIGFGSLSRKGRRLSLPGPQRLFQQPPQPFVLSFQRLDLSLELSELFGRTLFRHDNKITASRIRATLFSIKVLRR